MQVSKKRLKPKIKQKINNLLYQTIADIKTPSEAAAFLQEALSEVELEMLAKRLAIAYYLHQGKGYKEIKDILSISSTTIATIAEQIKKGKGFKIALKKIEAEEWAEKWVKKINQMMKPRRK